MKVSNYGKIALTLAAAVGALGTSVASANPVTAVVRLKERVSMQALAREVINPASARYGQPFTPAEIRALAAPSQADYQATLDGLRAAGFTVTKQSKTHLWVSVTGEKSLFESTFATQLQMQGSRRRQLSAAIAPATLPLIASVVGLDSTRQSHPKYILQHASGARAPQEATGPGGYLPPAIKTAYNFDSIYSSGYSGGGQDVAVATYDDFNIDDVKFYYNYMHLAPMPTVDKVQFNGVPTYQENSAGETQLDAEFIGMIAPGSNVHVFSSATNDDAGEAAMFTAILDDNRAKIVNYSWGACEAQITPAHKDEMERIFARAVAQGVNIMVASGDAGSDGCQNGTTVADWPGANDFIVAVGGTSLHTSGSRSETGWSGSGGGISSLFPLPSWQSSFGAPYLQRSFPDVSFNADPYTGEPLYYHSNGQARWGIVGGTSMAAPQWAGFLALVGEARARAGKQTLGYINPILYALPDAQRASMMNDITSGSNGAYTAVSGWDAVTGLGSMKADAMLSYFSGL